MHDCVKTTSLKKKVRIHTLREALICSFFFLTKLVSLVVKATEHKR